MDDESEADLYGDLLPFDRRNDEDFKKIEKANAKLKHENDQLKQRIERLLLENRSLAQDKKKLETNFSSLIKTAQTEMKRKDQTIAELRREKDSVVFRRGRNTRYDSRPQERIQPDPQEIHWPEPVEQSWEPPCLPKPSNQPYVTPPIVEETKSVVIPDNHAEEVAAVVAKIVPNGPTIVPTSNECPKTVFSKRHSFGVNKPLVEATLPAVPVVDVKSVKEKPPQVMIPITTVSTPETQPEAKKKKRITPVMISEPTQRVVDKNKNKIIPPALGLEKSFSKVAYENRNPIAIVTTPKAATVQTSHVTPTTDPIVIPKSKINTHVKATFDTSNAKTTDFKRRVPTHVRDAKPKPATSPKSPLKRIPSFVSENSSDGLRRPSNYDLMKRNVKVKYHALDSPKKSDRSRRSRSRSVWPRENRDRSKQSRRVRSDRRSEPRRKDGETSKRRSPSRRKIESSVSKLSPTPDNVPKRDVTSPRRIELSGNRRVPTFSELQNFSPVHSSTAKKGSDRKSSRDRTLPDSQVPSTSKTKVRLDDVLEKSVGKLSAGDRLDRSQVESAIAASRSKTVEPSTESPTAKSTETVKKVPSSTSVEPKTTVNVTSHSKSTEAKRKSIEAVADSLTIKLTNVQTTETTSKIVESFTVSTVPKASTSTEENEPKTRLTTVESTTKTRMTDVLSVSTNTIMPIPPRDFLSARILADYKTPTASAENSREISQPKTMSPPDVPKPKSAHAPTSFSGIKLGDPKAFSYPFTPMKMDIAKDCISFPSLITPLKATPVKVDYVEEDSLDMTMRLHLARNKDGLGVDGTARTVTRVETDVEWRLRALETDVNCKDKASSVEEKVDEAGGKVSDNSVAANDDNQRAESRKEDEKKKKSDAEDGEITDDESSKDTSIDTSKDTSKDISKDTLKITQKDASKDALKESAKPMVTFFKKGKSRAEPKGKRTRLAAAAAEVVSLDQMSSLRQKLLARNECIAPARKDIRDYEIRLKSPFKASPRVSSASGSKCAPRVKAVAERLTYNEFPANGDRSITPEESGRRSVSPSAMFLTKSPERIESRKPTPKKQCSQSRNESPNAERRTNTARENVPLGTSLRREVASSSRSRSPRGNEQTNARYRRENADRHSTSVSHSRSRSPQPPPLRRPQRLRTVSQSRSRSPKPGAEKRSQRRTLAKSRSKSPTKLDQRSHRARGSPARPRDRSRSASPPRSAPKINDRLLRLANCNGGGAFRRRRSRYIEDSTGDCPNRRSRTKSNSRSASPFRNERRNSRSQESPGKTGRAECRRGEGRRDRSVSPETGNGRGNEGLARESGGRTFRRRRTVFKDPPVSEQSKELIERILDSGSGISEKNISPARKPLRSVAAVESPPDAPNLPDILATLDSGRSPVKSRPVELRPAESRPVEFQPIGSIPVESRPVQSQPVGNALDDLVSKLVRTTNPDLQKCLDSIQTNFAPANAESRKCLATSVACADKATTETPLQTPSPPPLSNGFARKRRSVRMLPQSEPSPKAAVSVVEAPRSSEVTPVKPGETPNVEMRNAEVPSAAKAANGHASATDVAAASNGFPFARRRRTIRMLPPSNATTPSATPNPTPTKESKPQISVSPRSDFVTRTEAIGTRPVPSISLKSTEAAAKSMTGFSILERALGWPDTSDADQSVAGLDSSSGTQASLPSDRKRNLDASDASDRADKRKRDSNGSGDGNPWTKRRRSVVKKEVKTSNDLARKAKSLFGSDTEEDMDYSVRDSEYVKLASDSEESFVSDAAESDDSQEHWKPPRKHVARKERAPESDDSQEHSNPPRKQVVRKQRASLEPATSIWPARPEEPKRRTTMFLEDLPKSSEKIIEELMNRASKSILAKKKRHGTRAKTVARATTRAPKSAETVPTDSDSD